MSVAILKKEIKSKEMRNLYIFFGEERFLIDYYIKIIKEIIIEPEVNISVFRQPFNLDEFVKEIQTVPLLSDKKLLLVYDVDLDIEFLEMIPEYCIVILIFDEKPKIKNKSFELINKNGLNSLVVEYKKQSKIALNKWIIKYLESFNKSILQEDEKNAEYIIEVCNRSMYLIKNELDKLICFCHNKDYISYKDISELLPQNTNLSIFEFSNSILSQDKNRFSNFIKSLSNFQKLGPEMLSYIYSFLYDLLIVKIYAKDLEKIKKIIKPNKHFLISRLLALSPKIELNKLREYMKLIEKVEEISRYSYVDINMLIQSYLLLLSTNML